MRDETDVPASAYEYPHETLCSLTVNLNVYSYFRLLIRVRSYQGIPQSTVPLRPSLISRLPLTYMYAC